MKIELLGIEKKYFIEGDIPDGHLEAVVVERPDGSFIHTMWLDGKEVDGFEDAVYELHKKEKKELFDVTRKFKLEEDLPEGKLEALIDTICDEPFVKKVTLNGRRKSELANLVMWLFEEAMR